MSGVNYHGPPFKSKGRTGKVETSWDGRGMAAAAIEIQRGRVVTSILDVQERMEKVGRGGETIVRRNLRYIEKKAMEENGDNLKGG